MKMRGILHCSMVVISLWPWTSLLAADGTWTSTSTTGTWSTTGNWLASTVANGSGSTAFFTSDIIANTTVTLDSNRTIGNITFSDNGANGSNWTLSGANILTLGGTTPTITATTNSTIASTITGSSITLTKAGARPLTLSGSNTFTGSTVITDGSLILGNTSGLGAAGQSVTLLNNGTTLDLHTDTSVNAYNLTVSGNATIESDRATTGSGIVNTLGTLSIAAKTLSITTNTSHNVTTNTAYGVTFGTTTLTGNATFDVANNGTANGTLTLGAVGGAFSLTKSGAGTLALGTASTYSGGTTVSAGSLTLTGGGGASGTIRGAVTVNNGATLRLAANDVTGYAGDSTCLTSINLVGGTLDITTLGGGGQNQTLGNATITMTGGTITGVAGSNMDFFQGSSTITTLASAASSTISGVTLSIRQTGGLTITTADGLAATDLHISSVIKNDSSYTTEKLNKAGAGTLVLSATNTYSGPTQITAGVLSVATIGNGGTAGNLGQATNASANIILNGGTLQYTGSSANTDRGMTMNNTAGNSIDIATNSTNLTVSGVITGSGGFTKIGNGTLTLNGTSQNTLTGGVTVNSGVLNFDFTNRSTDIVSTSNALVLSGGTMLLTGKANTANSQTMNGLTLNPGASQITLTANASSNPLLLNFGAFSRNAGSTLNITQPTGTISTTNGIVSSTANSNGILSGAVTIAGNNWAVSNGNSGMTALASGSYTNDTWASTNNTTVTANSTQTSGSTTNSLRFNQAGSYTVTLSGTNIITTGGILVTSTVGNNLSTISGGTLKGTTGKDLIVIQNNTSNGLTISSIVADNTTATALTKSGSGLLTLSTANTFTGNTYINAGTVRLDNASSLNSGAYSANIFNAGSFQFGSTAAQTISGVISGSGSVNKDTGTTNTLVLSGNNTFTGGLSVSAGTVKGTTASAFGGLKTGNTVTISDSGTLDLAGVDRTTYWMNVTAAGTGVGGGIGAITNSGGDMLGSAGIRSLTLAGNTSVGGNNGRLDLGQNPVTGYSIDGGGYTLTKVGTNTMDVRVATITNLAGVNVNAGLWYYELQNHTTAATQNTTHTVNSSGTLSTYGGMTLNFPIVMAGGNLRSENGTGTWTGALQITADSTVNTSNPVILTGQLSGNTKLTKDGTGTLTLNGSSTSTGGTAIQAGSLIIGHTAALGAAGQAVALNGGTLDLHTDTSVNAYNVTVGGNATIENDRATAGSGITNTFGTLNIGSNTLNITTNIGHNVSSNTSYGVTFGTTNLSGNAAFNISNNGTATGTLTLGAIAGNAYGITKSGAGTLRITAAGSYGGTTTVSAGTLEVTSNNALGTTDAGTSVTNGATLKLTNVNYSSSETLSINGTGTGAGGALTNSGTSTFAGQITAASNATISNSGTLTMTGGIVKNGTTLTLTGNGTFNVSGIGISGSNAGSDLAIDGSILNLNVVSTYNGPTSIYGGGTLALGVNHALPSDTTLTLGSASNTNGTFDLASRSQSLVSIATSGSGSRIVTNSTSSSTSTLTLTGTTTFGGSIQNGNGTTALTINVPTSSVNLTSTNTYTGATSVTAGTLHISGSLGNTAVTVADGATLKNNGTIGGNVTTLGNSSVITGTGIFASNVGITGILSPGNSPGYQLYENDLTLGSSSNTTIELSGLSRSDLTHTGSGYYDAIDVMGKLTLDGKITITLLDGFTPQLGNTFNLFDWGTVDSTRFTYYSDIVLPILASGWMWDTSSFTTNGQISVVVVPEPSAFVILSFISCLAMCNRRRSHS